MRRSTKTFAIGTMLAGVAGFVMGVLFAPKSGEETRKDIKDSVSSVRKISEKALKQSYGELTKVMEEVNKKIAELTAQRKHDVEEALSKAESVRIKIREILSALHEGVAEDEDLNAAVKEAHNIVNDLRKYITK